MSKEMLFFLIVVFPTTASLVIWVIVKIKLQEAYQKGYDTAWVDRQIFDGKRMKVKLRRLPNGQFTNVK